MLTRTTPARRAFAAADFLATLGGISLLALVGAPMTGNSRLESEQAVCASHLKALGQASVHYAYANSEQFPSLNGGAWPWDIPVSAANRLIENGATRRDFYCPSVTRPDRDELWRFSSSSTNDLATPETGFRVVGYQFAFVGAGRVKGTNVTESLRPKAWNINGATVNPPLAERVIVADAILSVGSNEQDRSNNRYSGIDGGLGQHDSAHLAGNRPAGGNLLMADGHIDWRPFSHMKVRTIGDPAFWW